MHRVQVVGRNVRRQQLGGVGGPGNQAISCGALPWALETIPRIFFDKIIWEPGDASKPHLLSALQMGKLRQPVSNEVSELQTQELLQAGTLSSRDDQL